MGPRDSWGVGVLHREWDLAWRPCYYTTVSPWEWGSQVGLYWSVLAAAALAQTEEGAEEGCGPCLEPRMRDGSEE